MAREELKKQLEGEEGRRLKPYLDIFGNWTIGIGRNLSDSGISDEEADYLFENDVRRIESSLERQLPWFGTLDEVRQDVLIDLAFNMGIGGLLQFRMMLGAAELGNFEAAGDRMLESIFAEQVPTRAHRLAQMMRTGLRVNHA